MNLSKAKSNLLAWYAENRRPLPWRENRDPYRIWISETMLQQTTTTAVIPYFERFVERFPTLRSLAEAPQAKVLEAWAGLGYYSRARNLHKAAIALQAMTEFPRSHKDLIELPGFGPYTSRSVASLAFDESVGVVDGNVIRVLSRVYGRDWEWWNGKVRTEIQNLADAWVKDVSSYEMNQALMELGRTICTPKQVTCLLCPLRTQCEAFKAGTMLSLPKPKPRREREIWVWEAQVNMKQGRVLLIQNKEIPFLLDHWMLPGRAAQKNSKPSRYDYKHSITHHDIYVTVKTRSAAEPAVAAKSKRDAKWVTMKEIRQYAPTSLVHKALDIGVAHAHEHVLQTKTGTGRSGPSRSEGHQGARPRR